MQEADGQTIQLEIAKTKCSYSSCRGCCCFLSCSSVRSRSLDVFGLVLAPVHVLVTFCCHLLIVVLVTVLAPCCFCPGRCSSCCHRSSFLPLVDYFAFWLYWVFHYSFSTHRMPCAAE